MIIALTASPPLGAETPDAAQFAVTTVTGVLVAVTLVYTLAVWQRRGTPLYLAILAGGAVAALNEPALDLVSQIYFPSEGAWKVFEAYGRTIPAWAVLSYTLYFGMQTLVAVEFIQRRGATRQAFWGVIIGTWVFNSALEVTMLRTDIYFYFGYQPLRIGDFPAVWLVLNSVGVALAVLILLRLPRVFKGRRVALAAAVPPLCQVAALWLGTPHFLLLNSNQSHMAKTAASLLSIVAGLVVLDVLGRTLASPADRPGKSFDESEAMRQAGLAARSRI